MQAFLNLQREILNTLSCGRVHSPVYPLHFHSQVEIYLIQSGEVEIIVNDQTKVLKAGEISVALSFDAHGYRTPKEAEAIFLSIPTDYCADFMPLLEGRRLSSPFLSDPATYDTVLRAMKGLMAGGNELTRRGLVYLILGAVLDQMSVGALDAVSARGFSAEILIYIGKNFREALTLPMVAKEFGYSESYLSRSFHSAFGISFVRYLMMVRLREAVLLLQSGKMTVTQCALESGFGSMSSFYRAFGDEFGCTPKEYLAGAKAKP